MSFLFMCSWDELALMAALVAFCSSVLIDLAAAAWRTFSEEWLELLVPAEQLMILFMLIARLPLNGLRAPKVAVVPDAPAK
jgi:hypothetical protein